MNSKIIALHELLKADIALKQGSIPSVGSSVDLESIPLEELFRAKITLIGFFTCVYEGMCSQLVSLCILLPTDVA